MVETGQPEIISRVLVPARWSLYASRTYLESFGRPTSPYDLRVHQVIGFDDSMAGTPGARWLAENVPDASVALMGNSVGSVVQAAESGAGIAMIPCFLVEGRPDLVRLFDHLAVDRSVWIAYRRDTGQIARVRAVIDFLAETIIGDGPLFIGNSGVTPGPGIASRPGLSGPAVQQKPYQA